MKTGLDLGDVIELLKVKKAKIKRLKELKEFTEGVIMIKNLKIKKLQQQLKDIEKFIAKVRKLNENANAKYYLLRDGLEDIIEQKPIKARKKQ